MVEISVTHVECVGSAEKLLKTLNSGGVKKENSAWRIVVCVCVCWRIVKIVSWRIVKIVCCFGFWRIVVSRKCPVYEMFRMLPNLVADNGCLKMERLRFHYAFHLASGTCRTFFDLHERKKCFGDISLFLNLFHFFCCSLNFVWSESCTVFKNMFALIFVHEHLVTFSSWGSLLFVF